MLILRVYNWNLNANNLNFGTESSSHKMQNKPIYKDLWLQRQRHGDEGYSSDLLSSDAALFKYMFSFDWGSLVFSGRL